MRLRWSLAVPVVCLAVAAAAPLHAQRKVAPPAKKPAPAEAAGRKQGSLGTKDPGLFNLTGSIYFLEDGTGGMPPDLRVRKVEGTIYTDRIDVPVRSFTDGFPGVTDRYEWFGIVYTGRFFVEVPGSYLWSLQSDDGSRLWIDGKQVIDNDGVHGFTPKEGRTNLAEGAHDMKLWYYQGPATEIGLQLFVTPPKGAKKAFDLADFAGPMAAAIRTLKAEATPDGIKIRLDAALLFDTAKWDLKPRAQQAIKNLSQVVAAYPAAHIKIVGYTDAVGADDYNLGLSRSRAESVKTALAAYNPPSGVTFETQGQGKANPVASNDTAAGRTLNRRVEVFIKPLAAGAFEATARPDVQAQPEKADRTTEHDRPADVAAPPEAQAAAVAGPAGRQPRAEDRAVEDRRAAEARRERTSTPAPGPRPGTPEMIAAVNRVKYVIARYAESLGARDEATLARLRADISDDERALLKAEQCVVRIEVGDVQVAGTTATATCQRSVEATVAGKTTRTSGAAVLTLTRRPEGWVITAIK